MSRSLTLNACLLGALGFVACSDNGQISAGSDGGAGVSGQTAMTSCLGDPDNPGSCTFWTCSNVPIEFGHKIHCEGGHMGNLPPMGGQYPCAASQPAGEQCPPPNGGIAGNPTPGFNCVASNGHLSCDSNPICDANSFPNGTGCAQCTTGTCAVDACSASSVCTGGGGGGGSSGSGGSGGPCLPNQVQIGPSCVTCEGGACSISQCAQQPGCQSCPSGSFNDGSGCMPCTGADCSHSACRNTSACNGGGGSGGGSGNCQCVPGATRYCDGPTYCNWGFRVCQPDGSWGSCQEMGAQPAPGCNAGPYNYQCCIRNTANCCEDLFGHPHGSCQNTCR